MDGNLVLSGVTSLDRKCVIKYQRRGLFASEQFPAGEKKCSGNRGDELPEKDSSRLPVATVSPHSTGRNIDIKWMKLVILRGRKMCRELFARPCSVCN